MNTYQVTLKQLKTLLKDNLIDDLINIIHKYTIDDGIICHKCKRQVSLENDCIQCEWIISWDK